MRVVADAPHRRVVHKNRIRVFCCLRVVFVYSLAMRHEAHALVLTKLSSVLKSHSIWMEGLAQAPLYVDSECLVLLSILNVLLLVLLFLVLLLLLLFLSGLPCPPPDHRELQSTTPWPARRVTTGLPAEALSPALISRQSQAVDRSMTSSTWA